MMRGILLALSGLAAGSAIAQQYGSWSIDRLKDQPVYVAFTSNESGGAFGKICDSSECKWVVTMKTTCERDSLYPALLNAQSGAMPLRLQCAPNETALGRYIILDYNTIETAVATGEQLGIAVPLNSGEFRVARWSIKGWLPAAAQLAIRVKTLVERGSEKTL